MSVTRPSYAIRFDGTTATIKVIGAADFESADQLRGVGEIAFGHNGVETVLVDCAGLTSCDTTVLGVFGGWQSRARSLGIELDFKSVPPRLAGEVSAPGQVLDTS